MQQIFNKSSVNIQFYVCKSGLFNGIILLEIIINLIITLIIVSISVIFANLTLQIQYGY